MRLAKISVDKSLVKAKSFVKRGEVDQAHTIYKSILLSFPQNIRAKRALEELEIKIKNNHSDSTPEKTINQLINLYNSGSMLELVKLSEKLIKIYSNDYFIWNINGAANKALGITSEALKSFHTVIDLNPNFPDGYNNLGVIYREQDDLDKALDLFNKAINLKPEFAFAYNNRGLIFKDKGKIEDALADYQKALTINPNYADPYNNIGIIRGKQGDQKAALELFLQALKLNPNNPETYNNIGSVKLERLELEEALKIFEKSIDLYPNFVMPHFNKGIIYEKLFKRNNAIESYKKALAIKPEFDFARAQKLHQQSHIGDWKGIKQDSSLIPQLGILKEIMPLTLLSLDDAPERHKKRAELLNKNRFLQKPLAIDFKVKEEYKPIRVAYFSSDFKEHPVAYLLARVFEKHDRSQFKVYGYSIKATKKDSMHKRLVTAFDEFKDLSDVSDKEAALIAREDGIDIAIDLNGFTANSRTGIFAYRAAPIQINYLGFPGTMGADFIDYIIADEVLIPESSQKFYSEKPIYLPHTYMPTDNTREISTKPITRTEVGLPEDSFVFCCFNNNYKISSEEFDIWMRILGQVANSVLWLRKSNEWSEANFIKEAKKRNIDPSRLIFAGKLDMKEHLARHRLADLFLDTFNFNAHTTASEALWTGLPVVTKMGKGFASRVAASLLNALDCPELITETKEDYEALIMELATDPKKLLRIREKVTSNRLSKPLFNTELYIKNLENSFKQVHENYIKEIKLETVE
jgi:predicted O-linked N-acetylglucosamine transferase (SPINDLY family)